jgi:PLP dependent protein
MMGPEGNGGMSGVARNYREVVGRVEAACRRTGREPGSVRIIAISKTQPLERVREAWEAGIREFGENRARELVEKADVMGAGPAWHFVGHLQTNKVRQVVGRAVLIQSVDTVHLARAIDEEAGGRGIRQPVLLQVNVAGEETKSGFEPKGLDEALTNILSMGSLEVKGLMTIAPFTGDEDEVRRVFAALRELRDEATLLHPRMGLKWLSMGMTNDFEIAVEEGASLLRIGTAIFGGRG